MLDGGPERAGALLVKSHVVPQALGMVFQRLDLPGQARSEAMSIEATTAGEGGAAEAGVAADAGLAAAFGLLDWLARISKPASFLASFASPQLDRVFALRPQPDPS